MATNHRNPQPPQATQPPNSPRRDLRGIKGSWPAAPGSNPDTADKRAANTIAPPQKAPNRFPDGHRPSGKRSEGSSWRLLGL